MLLCSKIMANGHGLSRALIRNAQGVLLDWDTRQKSRFDAVTDDGCAIGVFLSRGTTVRGGDVLIAEDGRLIRVDAAPQQVLKITTCQTHGTPFDLIRAAYHLGNRHVPIELTPTYLHIEPDHVLADMLRAMHLIVTAVQAPFEPEAGAYSEHGHGHGATHAHGDSDHPHPHGDHPHGH